MVTVGVLSDTHGELHPTVPGLFRDAGVAQILHAGDVGGYNVISLLRGIAPVVAVRGNIDTIGLAADLPGEVSITIEDVTIFMTHIGARPSLWLRRLPQPRPAVAICGHSHVALLEQVEGVLFLNPGAAGTQPRFNRPLTAALLRISDGHVEAEIVEF